MPVPLAVLDTALADEALLERDELRICTLHALRCLNEALHRVVLARRPAEQPSQPLFETRGRLARKLLEQLPEVLLGGDFLFVELVACVLELAE